MSVVAEPGFMPSAVPCLQREAEFTQLLDLYRERKPMSVLEIGTYYGGTLYHWLRNAQPGALVVSVDSYATGVDNRDTYFSWAPDDVSLHAVAGDNRDPDIRHEVLRISESYEWVFIDAGHQYEEVRSDWLNYGSLGAVVAFHDINYPQVGALWREIRSQDYAKTREFVFDSTEEWHGIGVVFRD